MMAVTRHVLAMAIGLALGIPTASAQTMDHSQMQGMDHAAHQKKAPAKPKPEGEKSGETDHSQVQESAPTEPRTPIPAVTAADRAAAVPPHARHDMVDNAIHGYMLINRLEAWDNTSGTGTGTAWEGRGWIGTDVDRAWLRTEGERVSNRTESATAEVLYGHSVSPWWDVVAGVRHDFRPGDGQTFAAFGVQGLAPQKFEVEATAYVGQRGQTAARFEVEYELLLTNRLILQPLVEVNAYGRDDRLRDIGSGLSTAEAGLRLRYEFTRRFAPYIGVTREQAFGRTADFRRQDGHGSGDTRLVIGFRSWF